jgi:hypothetical protein
MEIDIFDFPFPFHPVRDIDDEPLQAFDLSVFAIKGPSLFENHFISPEAVTMGYSYLKISRDGMTRFQYIPQGFPVIGMYDGAK